VACCCSQNYAQSSSNGCTCTGRPERPQTNCHKGPILSPANEIRPWQRHAVGPTSKISLRIPNVLLINMRNSCDHLTATLTTPISFLESAGSSISIGERRFPDHATPGSKSKKCHRG